MKNIIRKTSNILLITSLLFCSFFVSPVRTSAKTLRDIKNEYQRILNEYNQNKKDRQLTQAEINKIGNNIALIKKTIEDGEREIIKLNNENLELAEKMDEKDKEIKRILNFLEVSEGENVYLEYAFGAKTFTDFIYRMAITEQLSNYNDNLIKEYNEMIEKNKKNTEAIGKKNKELQGQQVKLNTELAKLKNQANKLIEDAVGQEDALKQQAEIIKMYENDYHCKLDEDLSVCANNALPPDTTFWRPTTYGYISSEFGYRLHPTQGIYKLHTGVDIAVSEGTPVYPVASGRVITTWSRYYCGGNMIFLQHRINGQNYTSVYMHLQSMNVKAGDIVTKDTVIAKSGGGPSTWAWETCSTGGHLHLSILYGVAGTDYVLFSSTYNSRLINPRQVINFPVGAYYYNRTSRY